ncbi:hypothetical protein DWX17_22225 [[Clostridium] innocuum]|nr:hypothetical protein DWX17_22225 [[Clostridium] innocuum]
MRFLYHLISRRQEEDQKKADLLFILFQKEKNTCLSKSLFIWYNNQKRKLGMYEFSYPIPAISCDKLELL